jgi:hypothetical protein
MLPDIADLTVLTARALPPFGYHIVLTAGGRLVELHAAMTATWRPDWVFDAFADDQALHIAFPPSYVQAGSGVTTLHRRGQSQIFGPATHNGYEGEWRAIAGIVAGRQAPPPLSTLIDDLRFALQLADDAAARVRGTDRIEVTA